jgi:hypothetical protein
VEGFWGRGWKVFLNKKTEELGYRRTEEVLPVVVLFLKQQEGHKKEKNHPTILTIQHFK